MNNCEISNNTVRLNGKIIFNIESAIRLNDFLFNVYNKFNINYPKFHKMDSVSKLGVLTASLLFKTNNTNHNPLKTGIIISSASGCYMTDLNYINALKEDPESTFPALFTYTLPSIVIGEICIKQDIQGENLYLISNSLESRFLKQLATIMINEKGMEKCLIGWVEITNENKYNSFLEIIRK